MEDDRPNKVMPERLMAHRIIFSGETYGLSIAEKQPDGGISVKEYDGEEMWGTEFVNGTVEIFREGEEFFYRKV